MRKVKTRGGIERSKPFVLNEFPRSIVESICKRIVFLRAVGQAELSGDQFSQIFADSISGQSLGSPVGIADISWNGCGWSAKTVKNKHPHRVKQLRLICGRNSPDYSAGISDPRADIQRTGQAVLDIYNVRIQTASSKCHDLRLVVLIRNMETQEFTLFERPIYQLVPNNYVWKLNPRGNLEAFEGGIRAFTWQPHGSQFTIHESVPLSATRFRLSKAPPSLEMQPILDLVGFSPDWIDIL